EQRAEVLVLDLDEFVAAALDESQHAKLVDESEPMLAQAAAPARAGIRARDVCDAAAERPRAPFDAVARIGPQQPVDDMTARRELVAEDPLRRRTKRREEI